MMFHSGRLYANLVISTGRHSIDTPRCIEVCNELGWIRSLCKVPPPSVIFACRESHEQVIQAYNLYKNATAERHADADTTRWVRLEYDIIHMNLVPTGQEPDLAELSRAFAKPGHTTPIRQHARLNSQVHLSTDKWLNRPFGFDKIKTLAICRDLLVHLPDDYESFVRHFFPNLLVLIVLIDNETDIDEDWSIHDLEYGRYEKAVPKKLRSPGNPHGITRLDFIKKCKGPFKEVKLNIDYRMDIEFEMRKRFEKEEDSYDFYIAPRIRVLGASVPEGVSVDECGRLPAKLAKGKNNKYDANPFGDSVNEDFSTIRS